MPLGGEDAAAARAAAVDDHFVLEAFRISACASLAVSLSSFQNLLTASLMAPSAAGGTAMPWAIDGSNVLALDEATKSLFDSLAQSSNLSSLTSRRTGMEPLFRLNSSWNDGDMMALARSFCAFWLAGSFSWNMANESMLKV